MKRLILTLLSLASSALIVKGQIFEGSIKDGKTNAGLSYVNVGVIGKAAGTVTNEEGKFKLDLSRISDADSLRISMIGYAAKSFSVADLKKYESRYKAIVIEPVAVQLKDVKVKNRKWKEGILGNKTESKNTSAGFTSNKLGNEIGIIINIKRAPTNLKRFNASLAETATADIKLRLNFYTVKEGKPDQPIQHENIFVTIKKGEDKVSVDLMPYNLTVEDKFFVSLENIESGSGHMMFSASLLSSFMARETSQANWEKVGIVGIGFNVLAEY